MTDVNKPQLKLLLAAPRGFCAGVVRAIDIVEEAIATYGRPVYVRHEIVHNKFVVDSLRDKGAIFVEELDEIPDGDHPVIFSAHGVPKTVPQAAKSRNMFYLDATCPLVSKVHMEAARHFEADCEIILIGHEGHPEVVGTMGQLPEGSIHLIETEDDARRFEPKDTGKQLAFITQTTLSLEDTRGIIKVLHERFPHIKAPHKEDICYATTNRQGTVKQIAAMCDILLVVGAPNSSNSRRLVEVARSCGCEYSLLVQRADEIDWQKVGKPKIVGITAGASAPEVLVSEVVSAFQERFDVTIEKIETAKEAVSFKLPARLREDMAAKVVNK